MDIKNNKELLHDALNQAFVDDYNSFNNIVIKINKDMKVLEIDYQWSYNDFCVEFLDESMKKIEQVDIFNYNSFDDFNRNFWKFNLIVVRTIIANKFDELGYDYESYINRLYFLNNPQVNN